MKKNCLTIPIIALFAIGFTASGENISLKSNLETYEEEQNESDIIDSETDDEDEYSDSDVDDAAETGYQAGYEMGFNMADFDAEPDAKMSFTIIYGAPRTAEEKEKYKLFKQNYERGYRDGERAGNQ